MIFIGALILWTIYLWPGLRYKEVFFVPFIDKTPVFAICQYPFWMLFGWIAYTYRPTRGFRYLIYGLGILATLIGMWCNIYNWIHTGDTFVTAVTQKFSILVFMKNTALFYFIVTVFRNHEFSETGRKILGKLSESTLIIYLVHMMFIYFMYEMHSINMLSSFSI